MKEQVYFETYSAAVNAARASVEAKGYEINEQDWFSRVNVGPGKPKDGHTTTHNIGLLKGGREQRKLLHIQVYNTGTSYELNYYIS